MEAHANKVVVQKSKSYSKSEASLSCTYRRNWHNFSSICFSSFKIKQQDLIVQKSKKVKGALVDNKMGHIFGRILQIIVLLKYDHLVEENKKTEYCHWCVSCSSRKDQTLTIWYFHTTTPNSDLNINNNMANKIWKWSIKASTVIIKS